MNYTSLTLGELLSSDNPAIKRNAVGILKQLQKSNKCDNCGEISNKLAFFIDERNGKEIKLCEYCVKETA